MKIEQKIGQLVANSIEVLYSQQVDQKQIQIQKTKKEFEGDVTIVIFPFVKIARKSPEATGQEIGEYLVQNTPLIVAFNVIKGFLNISIQKSYWIEELNLIQVNPHYGMLPVTEDAPTMMIEYSSPNTNKPLHLGHIRNNLLGYSIANIQKANGWKVVKTNIVNDRGIHICKSMLAWQKFGKGETPESSGMKGDHLVGKYYVVFDKAYKAEVTELMAKGANEEDAMMVANKIRNKVAENEIDVYAGSKLRKTVSIGLSMYPNDSTSFETVIKNADIALYEAKHKGRNQVIRFKEEQTISVELF